VKERLTGAIILVVLIVLLVPELLSGPSRSTPVPQAAATSSEEPPLRSYTINLADEPRNTATSAGAGNAPPQASGPAQPTAIVEPVATAPQPSTGSSASADASTETPQGQTQESPPAEAAPEKLPAAERSSTAARASSTGEWVVQLGVFANHANADRLARKLRAQGFHTLISESSSGGHTLWRVRAGPVAERATAEQLSARLRTAGHVGSIVPK
jgi:DedD protein